MKTRDLQVKINQGPPQGVIGGRKDRLKDRSRETVEHYHESPPRERHGHCNAALDKISGALRRAAQSPFIDEIERTEILKWFARPLFTIYDGKTNLVEHVSQYIQMMSLYSHIMMG